MLEYLLFLFLTIDIEFIIIYTFVRGNWKKVLFYTFLINCFTWPLAVIIVAVGANFYLVEFGVIMVESTLIKSLFEKDYGYSFGLSLLANVITTAGSFLL